MENEILKAYQETVNRIDDYFEYRNESKRDRQFIQDELKSLTDRLQNLTKAGQ